MIRATVHQTEVGLLYVRGRFERTLEPGRHWILKLGARVERIDARRRLLHVQSQEILTSDNVRDVILPGDLRAAFAEVVRARAEGRAALERARGESAALRNLANAARVIEGNPALMNLRILQAMSQEHGVPGTTRFVVNLPGEQPPA